jgi:hypothetical protein
VNKHAAQRRLGFYDFVKITKQVGYILVLAIEERVDYVLDGGIILEMLHVGGCSDD